MRRLLVLALALCLSHCAPVPATPVAPSNRIASGAGAGPSRGQPGTIAGDWREFWGEPGDLDYNDEYRVDFDGQGGVTVTPVGRDHPISEVAYRGGVLTFTQTTSFPVRYRLTLSRDRARLEGTATTPSLEARIRWERIEDAAPAR
ncbi:MAG: hypothetical protein JNK64_14290 [Myxococcales bacterium]|nr:hypothetical protein [Myxococcales bacterium]